MTLNYLYIYKCILSSVGIGALESDTAIKLSSDLRRPGCSATVVAMAGNETWKV